MVIRATPAENIYSGGDLDRVSARRRDETWIAGRFADPASLFLPVWRSRHLVAGGTESEFPTQAEAMAIFSKSLGERENLQNRLLSFMPSMVSATSAMNAEAAEIANDLEARALGWLRDEQGFAGEARLIWSADMRYRGQSYEIETLLG